MRWDRKVVEPGIWVLHDTFQNYPIFAEHFFHRGMFKEARVVLEGDFQAFLFLLLDEHADIELGCPGIEVHAVTSTAASVGP